MSFVYCEIMSTNCRILALFYITMTMLKIKILINPMVDTGFYSCF